MKSESVAECFAETVANFTDAIFCQKEILGAICATADFRQALVVLNIVRRFLPIFLIYLNRF